MPMNAPIKAPLEASAKIPMEVLPEPRMKTLPGSRMKIRMKALWLVLALGLSILPLRAQLLPRPRKVQRTEGGFTLTASTRLVADPAFAAQADYLAARVPLQRSFAPVACDAVRLLSDPSLDGEAYRLEVTPLGVTIRGGGSGGLFNGIQTLLQLLPPEVYGDGLTRPVRIDCCTIDDAPRFAYRGVMIDVARTWIDADGLRRCIDLLAFHKINRLHLHLSDDEGWRIEIKSHPELTGVGAFRGPGTPIRAIYGKWDGRYGGYYTQEQMRSLIRYAADRNIEIIPEIDLPGHSRNIARVHPEILCDYRSDTSASGGYDLRSAWCVAREENYTLLEEIFGELCALFPATCFHIGGDEVVRTQWEHCPRCRALAESRAMESTARLQSYFMDRLVGILARYGKRPMVWNEATDGGITREAVVSGWENLKKARAAAAAGYSTVVMPAEYFYFDMRQSPREEGHDWAAVISPERVASFDFAKAGFTPAMMQRVAGVEGAFWSEAYLSHDPEKPDYLDYMLFPRVVILSQLAWRGEPLPVEVWRKELNDCHFDRLGAMGVRYRLFPPSLTYADGRLVARAAHPDEQIFYAVDPSPSDDSSSGYFSAGEGLFGDASAAGGLHPYTGPVVTARPGFYRFCTRRGTGRSPWVATEAYYRTITPAVRLTSSMPESRKAPFERVERYASMAWTARTCTRGDWFLFTFDTPVACREIRIQTGNPQLPRYIFNAGHVEVSRDGVNFERAGTLDQGRFVLHPRGPVKALRVTNTAGDNGGDHVAIQPLRIRR